MSSVGYCLLQLLFVHAAWHGNTDDVHTNYSVISRGLLIKLIQFEYLYESLQKSYLNCSRLHPVSVLTKVVGGFEGHHGWIFIYFSRSGDIYKILI